MAKVSLELPDDFLKSVEEYCLDNELDFDKFIEFLLRIEINHDHKFGYNHISYVGDATTEGMAKRKARETKLEGSRKQRLK